MLLFRFQGRLFAYRSAHFGAKTSAWHWGRVSAALLRLLHRVLYFRHAAWVYVDDFFFLFPGGTASLQFTLSIILLQVIGAPLSWKKLEYDSSIEWNGWSIQPALMTAQLPQFKHEKITALIDALLQNPGRKNLEKIIGILLWATSLVHHVRFLLTSLYRDLYSIPATNYSIPPTQWEYLLRLLNDSATITVKNSLHLPLEAKVVEFRHSTITAKDQLPIDLPIDRHVWVRIRDPNCEKRKLSFLSKDTLQWSKKSLLPLLSSIPLNRTTSLTVTAAADAFADETEMSIGGWISIGSSTFWFSQKWNKVDLETFLPVSKSLQRYITSWEALAQLCIILMVHSKCTYRPGIINIQSGSDNTGAEANINHGFSTTEVLSDIIKLVSIKQIQFNMMLNVHHAPGEKNTKADNLSRGRLSTFPEDMRVLFQLNDIFDATPFPRYINPQVQWDLDIHPLAKLCYCVFFSFSLFSSVGGIILAYFMYHLMLLISLWHLSALSSPRRDVPRHCGQPLPQTTDTTSSSTSQY